MLPLGALVQSLTLSLCGGVDVGAARAAVRARLKIKRTFIVAESLGVECVMEVVGYVRV